METKKIIAICQSGGEFVNNKDGSLSYSGGDAYALDVDEQTKLSGFKKELADMYGWASSSMNIKYLLPSNRKTLITVSKDRDLQRMVNFAGDSGSVDVFIFPEAAAPNGTIVPASRASETTISEAGPLVEAPNVGYDPMEIHNGEPINSFPAASSDGQPQLTARDWENTITGVDQRFNSLSDFKEALHKFSVAHRFAYRYKKNDSHRVSVKCKVQGCPWRIYASRLSTTQLIAIKKMNPTHTCDGANVKARYQATRGWVGSIIKEKLKESPNCKAKEIADEIRREYGIELNYSQARRAKKLARMQLQGTSEEAYKLLPLFCEKIKETNPGSIANFSTKEDTTFHRLFVSFHASIVGFQQGCRPLLFLDSVPLLSKYPGVLLAAVSADGDDGIFPVAFAVVDVENEENWYWFLQELKSALLPPDEQPLTFVADVQNGLKESIAHIFSNAYHAYCLPSLAERLDRDLKGQFSHEARRFMLNDLYSAARATSNDAFQHAVRSIKGISDEAYEWVMQSEPIHWANAFFPGARYEHMGSNFGQEFYRWVAEAQELPITQLIDGLRGKTMDAIYTRRAESNQWVTKLTPSKEDQLQKEAHASQSLHINISPGTSIFEVSGESTTEMVDIENCTCSCTRWRFTGVPCCHAIAVIVGLDRGPYDYCLRYFTTECYRQSYAESINPVPSFNLLDLNELGDMAIVTITPPPTRRAPVKAVLKPSDPIDMIKRSLQCSKCKAIGHNKKTCKAA